MNRDIQMIAFDMFGVIITEGHLISNNLIHRLPPDTDKALVKQLYNQYNLGEIEEAEFWKPLGVEFDPTTAAYTKAREQDPSLRHQFLNSFELEKDFYQVIEQLKPHYKLSILSNFPPDWADYLVSKFELDKHFEPRIFSGHVGCKKPDKLIYQTLSESSGMAYDNIAFIDDKLENLEIAHELGMTTVHFWREEDIHKYEADYAIQNFLELKLFLTDKSDT